MRKEIRQDLQEFERRRAYLEDKNRLEAVEKRHKKGQRTARENIYDLCDKDSFQEIGSLIVAAQRGRKTEKELIEKTPADGLVTGIGEVNVEYFGKEKSKCYVMSYDYTVLAGTQGAFNHKKKDRMMSLAKKVKLPMIFFVEGGGGRPGDVDFDLITNGGLDIKTWSEFAKLSGKIPRIAIVSGYCFAGNAVIAGASDVIIATENISLGMGGPAMIAGGGLGSFHPKEIGPAKLQTENGVVDILVKDEAEAVVIAKKYLSYFQGNLKDWTCVNQEKLRDLIPENRKYAYKVSKIIDALCDEDSVLELRPKFARNMVTVLARIEGRPIGLIANSTQHLGGAIDSDASDKAARFMQLCDSFGLPIISLCDTPGFMVGPQYEKTAMVRHSARLFLVAASLEVPMITIVLRKAYGLGAMAMAGGSLLESYLTLSWQTGEFGGMGLEGAVKLGYRKELETIKNPMEREKLYNQLVAKAYHKGKALNAASMLEFDEVIDPKDTRSRIVSVLESIGELNGTERYIDAW
ncbi:MAG: acyl-CoA carboxylase subunit beta [Saprospiraceae bacterium]